MGRPQVGLPHLQGDMAKYQASFDMVELRPDSIGAPRPQTVRGWRKSVNPTFTFSVVLPRIVGELSSSKEAEAALTSALELAKLVEARCILLQTPPHVRPTRANREKLGALVAKLPRPAVALCWEPSGIWEAPDVFATARSLGLLPVVDVTETPVPEGPAVYTRIRSLGGRRAVSAKGVATIAAQLHGRRDAWVVVEDPASAQKLRSELETALTRLPPAMPPIVVRPSPGKLRADDEEQ